MRLLDITDQRFGRLVALRLAKRRNKRTRWMCLCDCGKKRAVLGVLLRSGATKSCGCIAREVIVARNQKSATHGLSGHAGYSVHTTMLQRCHNPKARSYCDYGARGIAVCKKWKDSFAAFWKDMGPSYRPGLTLERKNGNRGYCKSNCCWVTRTKQARNRKSNVWVPTPAGLVCLVEAATKAGLSPETVRCRMHRGWSSERLLEPVTKREAK